MRKLQTKDIFSALRLIQKANLKEELKPLIVLAAEGKANVEDIGIEGVITVIEIFASQKSESAIYEFLAGPFETDAENVEQMDLTELMEGIEYLAKESNLKNFFMGLQGLITKKL